MDEGATPLGELARLFFNLGAIAFGGPAAHIAMMEDEVVRRRRWLTREQFLDYLGPTNLIPGPNSTELAIHVGHARAGWRGLLVAGASFILPVTLIVTAIAWAYVKYGTLPQGEAILRGVKPVVIGVVLQAMWRLGRSAVKSATLAVVALTATGAAVATLGIFLPAFVFVALSGPLIPRLRRSPTAGAVLDGVNVASLALMVVVTWHLARSALVDEVTVTLALLSAVLLLWRLVNSAWLVLGGATEGLLLSR